MFNNNNNKETTMPKINHKLDTKYNGEENYTVQYFVWGKINEDYKTSSQPYEETYFQFIVDEVIKSIINKLEINKNV